MDLWQILANLHPKLVQFPIVLLLAGLLFDLLGLARRSPRAHWAAKILTLSGTVFLLFAFICGIYAEVWAGRAGIPQPQIEWHEFMANVASWGFVILAAWRLFLRPPQRSRFAAYVITGLLWYCLLGLTGYLGGKLVFNYGAAVTGATANTALSIHDLNTLAARQTDLNLRYSEWMHHIFGWMTLALAISLLAQRLFPKHSHRIKWIGPALLLCGGIFLFFFADLDLYRFTDLRQWRDREVELHKSIALIMFTLGAAGLYRSTRPSVSRASSPAVAPGFGVHASACPPTTQPDSQMGLAVAVMALIGGGLLFTHVHTVAPYANVAAGVYIAHVTLGLVALSIGGLRLLADTLPRRRQSLLIAFSAMMAVEAVLLITYNEGLPWFIGYGTYSRKGSAPDAKVETSTIAPFGPFRAELKVDPASGDIAINILDRFTSEPHPIPVDQPLVLLVARGYQETEIPLTPDIAPALPARYISTDDAHLHDVTTSHLHGHADFLKNAPAISARLALPISDSPNASLRMGYFDPWVIPEIAAVPPNELATYQCPMHPGICATQPGQCPLCQMNLIPIQYGVRTTLHDPAYSMLFTCTADAPYHSAALPNRNEGILPAATPNRNAGVPPAAAQVSLSNNVDPSPVPDGSPDILPNQPVTLTFIPRQNGQLLRNLALVHEHLLHLIVVSADLQFFDHVHPVLQPDGSLTLPYMFPHAGDFLLFADITPAGQRNQVFRLPVHVSGEAPPPAPLHLTPSPALAKEVSGYHIQLIPMPRQPDSGLDAQLLFRIFKNDQPVTDLSPYIGAMGHCVIISEDTQTYLHCHPEMLHAPAPDAHGGPDIAFHTLFPHPGKYKIWAQFNHDSQILIADFTLDIQPPILPAPLMRLILGD